MRRCRAQLVTRSCSPPQASLIRFARNELAPFLNTRSARPFLPLALSAPSLQNEGKERKKENPLCPAPHRTAPPAMIASVPLVPLLLLLAARVAVAVPNLNLARDESSTSTSTSSSSSTTPPPTPWLSILDSDGTASTVTPVVSTDSSGRVTTIDAKPTDTPMPLSDGDGGDDVFARCDSSKYELPETGNSQLYVPFCAPRNSTHWWVSGNYYVTWNPKYYAANSSVVIVLNYRNLGGGGRVARTVRIHFPSGGKREKNGKRRRRTKKEENNKEKRTRIGRRKKEEKKKKNKENKRIRKIKIKKRKRIRKIKKQNEQD